MQLENSFQVAAPPEKVFAYLLDVNKVAGCLPGAQLTDVVDATTFNGKVRIKVGPITVAYSGTAKISDRNDAEHSATLSAEGRETTGPGSARATAQMKVQSAGEGSLVQIVTEYHVAGRVAQFGRGVMEDVSRRLITEMATCIQSNLESSEPERDDVSAAIARSEAESSRSAAQPGQPPKSINAFSLLWHLVQVRVQRLFGRAS